MVTVLGTLSSRRKLFPSSAVGARVLHVVRAIVTVVVTAHGGPIDDGDIVMVSSNNVSRREKDCGDEDNGRDHAPLRHHLLQWHRRAWHLCSISMLACRVLGKIANN